VEWTDTKSTTVDQIFVVVCRKTKLKKRRPREGKKQEFRNCVCDITKVPTMKKENKTKRPLVRVFKLRCLKSVLFSLVEESLQNIQEKYDKAWKWHKRKIFN